MEPTDMYVIIGVVAAFLLRLGNLPTPRGDVRANPSSKSASRFPE